MGSLLSSRIVTVADFVTPEVIKVINPCCKLEKNHVHGYFSVQCLFTGTLDARGLLARQRRGASERVVLVGERPLAQAVKSFEHADPITLPVISPESRFDPENLIGRLEKRFLEGLLLVKCATILAKPVLQSFP